MKFPQSFGFEVLLLERRRDEERRLIQRRSAAQMIGMLEAVMATKDSRMAQADPCRGPETGFFSRLLVKLGSKIWRRV